MDKLFDKYKLDKLSGEAVFPLGYDCVDGKRRACQHDFA